MFYTAEIILLIAFASGPDDRKRPGEKLNIPSKEWQQDRMNNFSSAQ